MKKNYPGEVWKKLLFDKKYINKNLIEVSNFGRIRTFNSISKGNILKGSIINGYSILRIKLYTKRDKASALKLGYLKQQVSKLARKLKTQKEQKKHKTKIYETAALLESLKKKLSKKFEADLNSRKDNYQVLIHRLVADYFMKQPSIKHTIVGHLDHNKLNNRVSNLKWMTPEENYEHQKKSPHVIKEKRDRKLGLKKNARNLKLTVTKVMLLKKLLNQGKPVKQLAKVFNVSETQIIRIRKGENWAMVEAAK
jgi:hypothetical protein